MPYSMGIKRIYTGIKVFNRFVDKNQDRLKSAIFKIIFIRGLHGQSIKKFF